MGTKNGWHLLNTISGQRRTDDHLARKLHSRCHQVQFADTLRVKTAQSAVKVAYRARKEQPAKKAQRGIANVSMQPGHCSWGDTPVETVADDKICPGTQFYDKTVKLRKVVGVIRVADDDI